MAEKMEKSPLLQKLSAVLSRPLLQFLEDEKATQQARQTARIPQNTNLKQYPVATPTIPPPMGMAQAPAQPAPQAQPQQPAQPAQARPVGNGAGPTANPINSFGALSASGNINGNAAFGIKNSPDSLKTAGIASTGRSMADAAQGEGVDPTAAAVVGLLGAGALYGTYHGGKKLLRPILNRANLRTLPEEEIAKFSLPIKATNTQHAFAERYRAPGILGGFYMDTDEDALSNALHRMTKKRTGAQSRLDSGDYTPEDLDIAGKLLVNKYPNRYRLPAQMKTAQSDYLYTEPNYATQLSPEKRKAFDAFWTDNDGYAKIIAATRKLDKARKPEDVDPREIGAGYTTYANINRLLQANTLPVNEQFTLDDWKRLYSPPVAAKTALDKQAYGAWDEYAVSERTPWYDFKTKNKLPEYLERAQALADQQGYQLNFTNQRYTEGVPGKEYAANLRKLPQPIDENDDNFPHFFSMFPRDNRSFLQRMLRAKLQAPKHTVDYLHGHHIADQDRTAWRKHVDENWPVYRAYKEIYEAPETKTAQSDYLCKVTNMDFPVHPDPEDLDLDDEERMKTSSEQPTPKPKKKAKPASGRNYMPLGVAAGLLLSKALRTGYRAYQEHEDAEPMQYSPDMYNQSDLPAMNNDSKYAAFEFGQKMASMAPIYGALAGAGLGALNNAVNYGDLQRVGNYLTGNDSDAMYPGTFPNHSLDYLGRNMAEGAVLGGGAGVGYDALKLMLGGKAKEQDHTPADREHYATLQNGTKIYRQNRRQQEDADGLHERQVADFVDEQGNRADPFQIGAKLHNPSTLKYSAYRALQDIPSGAGPNQIEDAVMRFNQLRALVRPDTETLKARSLSRGGFQHELRRIATNSQGKEKYNLSEMAPNPNLRAALAGAAGLAGTGALAYMNGAEGLGAGLAGTGLAAGGAYLHGLHQRKNFKNTSKLLKDYGLLKPELLRQAYPLLADNYRAG